MRKRFLKKQNHQERENDVRSTLELHEIEEILFNRAAHYIRLRERSEKEMDAYLQKKIKIYYLSEKEINELVQKIISRLKELDLLNDKRFIEWWVGQRSYFKPRGSYLLRQELQQKGADRDEISFYFEDNKIDELLLAKEALAKKMRSLETLSLKESEKKALSFLMRRGFSFSIAKKAFEECKEKRYNKSKL